MYMDLINQFIENYKKKLNFYEMAGHIAARQLESALQAARYPCHGDFQGQESCQIKKQGTEKEQPADGSL